jgi:hypothetical protein
LLHRRTGNSIENPKRNGSPTFGGWISTDKPTGLGQFGPGLDAHLHCVSRGA